MAPNEYQMPLMGPFCGTMVSYHDIPGLTNYEACKNCNFLQGGSSAWDFE